MRTDRIASRSRMALGLAGLMSSAAAVAEPADLVLFNAKVLTVDEDFSISQAIAVKDGKIIDVGRNDIEQRYEAPIEIDLQGRTLMPGFNDTHVHMHAAGPRMVELYDATSIAEVQERVRAKAAELGPGEWITGTGWDEALFTDEKRNLVRGDIDEAAPDNPVMLTRAGGHSSVGNTLALEIAGITRDTPQPDAGVIEHDENGEPNGIIRERSDLYRDHVPPDTYETLKASYIEKMQDLLALGITSFHSASTSINDEPIGMGGLENPGSGLTFRRLQELHKEMPGQLPRVTTYISYPGAERLAQFPHHSGYGNEWVRLGGIGENGVDGGFTGPTAWTLADYRGQPGFRGDGGRFTDAELQEMVDTSAMHGWQMALHAIGDAAIVQTVNAYANALDKFPRLAEDHRWFLDHFTIMPPDETMAKMAKYGMMIAQQPNFAYNLDARYRETMDDWRYAHNNSVGTPWKKFGILVAFGSDNLPIGPMVGLHSAVTRMNAAGEVVGPEERVSMEDAIRAYTEYAAYLSWEEDLKGTLEVGKLADVIVLDTDPMTVAPDSILDMEVDMTFLGGKLVYDRAASDSDR